MQEKQLTLGSLFDGIGGFPFAATLSGITPVWASEIEPFCIAVTKQRFPNMLHLGSVTDINGAEIPPVDIITFGSPCQDLSVAGQRAGLDGERSGLFKEAVRIIYEMRNATNGRYPKYIIWENVPGAFTSNTGRDFKAVLEEITKADIPMPSSGKWSNAGMVRGGAICAAWRLFDAQYWGIPQRRKRIFLVGSFASDAAPKILFKRDSGQRYFNSRGTKGQAASLDIGKHLKADYKVFDARGHGNGEIVPTMAGDHFGHSNDYMAIILQILNGKLIARRPSPLECERLQGYPDFWTCLPTVDCIDKPEFDFWQKVIKLHKEINNKKPATPLTPNAMAKWYNKLENDGNKYKALGNSLAIPCALRVVGYIADYERSLENE